MTEKELKQKLTETLEKMTTNPSLVPFWVDAIMPIILEWKGGDRHGDQSTDKDRVE